MARSTKEKVIHLAQTDPFLTVEQLAQKSETTPRYVRTILSEARISLAQLRKEYARSMERRLAKQDKAYVDLHLPLTNELHVKEIQNEQFSKVLQLPQEAVLFQVSHLTQMNEIPVFAQLVTGQGVTVTPNCTSLRELIQSENVQLTAKEQWIEVLDAPERLQTALGSRYNRQVFRLCAVLYNDKQPVALEFLWIPVDGVALHWSGRPLEVKISATG